MTPRALAFMGAPAGVVESGWGYAACMLGGNLTILPRGVFLAITISEALIAVVGMLAFRRGTWKTRAV